MTEPGRDTELVLAPGEYAAILDTTKGDVNVCVGPYKTSLSVSDSPILWDEDGQRFKRQTNLDAAIKAFPRASEGFYIVLTNPAKDAGKTHPGAGKRDSAVELERGRRMNIPGPASFALWPGQVAQVIEGHHLRSNQYLLVRVYNDDEAKKNWGSAVVKPQTQQPTSSTGADGQLSEQVSKTETVTTTPPSLTMGQLIVIRGTEVSFYMPPTGIEVVPETPGKYVRDALTLERLEYCILLDESGQKRFVQGPAVVFPTPTETFVEMEGKKKFRAVELNPNTGLYVKVIAEYKGEGGKEHHVGEELFITGKDQAIYYPRAEHAVIKYGDREKHYAIAIPAGEGRYVLDRNTGEVKLVVGPHMFLPDPRNEVVVRRVLSEEMVDLLYPGNDEALDVNRRLSAVSEQQMLESLAATGSGHVEQEIATRALRGRDADITRTAGEGISRGSTYTAPRTITLNTKYEGAVTVQIWSGYAVLVVKKTGERKVVQGPATVMLQYDESLMPMEFSTGTPKTDARLERGVYLRVKSNTVSDIIDAETKDLCQVQVRASYRINFEGALPEKWFDVENYVKFLTEHLRSIIRGTVKQYGIEEFYANATAIIRDAILGVGQEGEKRPGRPFEENAMRVYDVEVLSVKIANEAIAGSLVAAQHQAVKDAVAITQKERSLELARRSEAVDRAILEEQEETTDLKHDIAISDVERSLTVELARIDLNVQKATKDLEGSKAKQGLLDEISTAELARREKIQAFENAVQRAVLTLKLQELDAEDKSVAARATAISADLIAALQQFGDTQTILKAAESMAPLAILGGESVVDALGKLLAGSGIGDALSKITSRQPRSHDDR